MEECLRSVGAEAVVPESATEKADTGMGRWNTWRRDPEEFTLRIRTGFETWLWQCVSEGKMQSKPRVLRNGCCSEKGITDWSRMRKVGGCSRNCHCWFSGESENDNP